MNSPHLPRTLAHGFNRTVRARGAAALLERVLVRGAARPLPWSDPILASLAAAGEADRMFARWCRFERYVDAPCRTTVHALSPTARLLSQQARPGVPPLARPHALAMLRLWATLLEAMGLTEVRASMDGVPAYPHADAAAMARLAPWSAQRGFMIDWAAPAAAEGASGVRGEPVRIGPAEFELLGAEGWPDPAARAFHCLAAALPCQLRLDELAARLGCSTRTLQRRLAALGWSCEALRIEARSRSAAWWLLHHRGPVRDIGFVCGYTDPPHFVREHKARTGLSPQHFRRAFARR